jgi:hypothetical protein
MDNPNPNKCVVMFECDYEGDCAYYRDSGEFRCKYLADDHTACTSSVAQANACVIYLKSIGLKVRAE